MAQLCLAQTLKGSACQGNCSQVVTGNTESSTCECDLEQSQEHVWVFTDPVEISISHFPFKCLGQLLASLNSYCCLRHLQRKTIAADFFPETPKWKTLGSEWILNLGSKSKPHKKEFLGTAEDSDHITSLEVRLSWSSKHFLPCLGTDRLLVFMPAFFFFFCFFFPFKASSSPSLSPSPSSFFFGYTCSIWKFPDQGRNLTRSCDLCRSRGNPGSLTQCDGPGSDLGLRRDKLDH